MGDQIRADFEIVQQAEEPLDDFETGPRLTLVTIHKRYQGEIDGTGVASVLVAAGERGSGYVATERVVGTFRGQSGSFVIQHRGIADGDRLSAAGIIVPHSGTGDLALVSGRAYEEEMGVLSLEFDEADPS